MNDKLKQRLLATFKEEASEHLSNIRNGLLELENSSKGEIAPELLEEIYRDAHSLKGAARAVNLADIVELCQSVENVFSSLKKGEIKSSENMFAVVQKGLSLIENYIYEEDENNKILMLDDLEKQIAEIELFLEQEKGKDENKEGSTELGAREVPEEKKEMPPHETIVKQEEKPSSEVSKIPQHRKKEIRKIDTIRIPAEKLEKILLAVEELIPVKNAFEESSLSLESVILLLEELHNKWSKNRFLLEILKNTFLQENNDKELFLKIRNVFELIEFNKYVIEEVSKSLHEIHSGFISQEKNLSDIHYRLETRIKESLMLPFSLFTEQFPLMIHDLATDLGKKVELIISGENIEIDKRILEELRDPLIHLLRNAVDHGIEKPEERENRGKPPKGMIRLEILQKNGQDVEIIVSDDGRGIDVQKIKEKAIRKGLVDEEKAEELSEREILAFIFESDFSTAEIVTEISGRGLGMAIVKEKILALGGSISIDTKINTGTKFSLVVPVTVATFRGVLVSVGGKKFIFNSASLQSVLRISPDKIRTLEGKKVIRFEGEFVSLGHLANILNIESSESGKGKVNIVILKNLNGKLAVQVDEIIKEQEILFKPLPKNLVKLAFVSGVTISSTGEIIPVLDTKYIFDAIEKGGGKQLAAQSGMKAKKERKKRILVVDDSITSRVLISDILAARGYEVKTAKDGLEAWTMANETPFDLIVSDVEMPRLDGFQLTAKIRQSEKLKDLPLVLVTGLEKQEHKEKGIEVGANAYIVKSDFEQQTLLDVIESLI
jgi:two-component system chemotaxis sensor kinase CheA